MSKSRSSLPLNLCVLMFCIIFLLNLNFTVLRSVRNTLTVTDLGSSASIIPYFELFGVLPAAILMTWFLSYLLRNFAIQTVFLMTLSFFLLFYVIFAFCYPSLRRVHEALESNSNPRHFLILNASLMIFYIVGELWKPALIQMLFLGFLNLNTSLFFAKRIYPFLMLGAGLGSILAGPTIMVCTSLKVWRWMPISSDHWSHSFNLMLLLTCIVGIAIGLLYHCLASRLAGAQTVKIEPKKTSLSLKNSMQACLQSSSLKWISWIVLADYIAYSLGEVIFLEVLRVKFPEPCDYCRYMGHLAFWSSSLTLISAAFITPLCVQKCRWVTVALVLPVALMVIEGLFFIFLRIETISSSLFGWSHNEWIASIVCLGSIQYCGCRALKYTFFETSKELAFVVLPATEQIQGKLGVDGICSRLGRGTASALSLTFISCAGGILASSFVAGITAFCFSLSWALATLKLGKKIENQEVIHV